MQPLMLSRWVSVCGATFFALLLVAVVSTSARANQISATSYDLTNGGIAGFGNVTLYDDSFTGSGNHTSPYASLSGGLGDLTDGVIATLNWGDCGGASPCISGPGYNNAVYVGWHSPNLAAPRVTFHFAPNTNIDEVKLYSNNGYRSDPVDFLMTGGQTNQSLTRTVGGNNSGPANLMFDFTNLGFTGDTLQMTFHYHPAPFASDWILLSEVQFFSAAAPGPVPAPEPATLALLGVGLAGLGFGRRKKV